MRMSVSLQLLWIYFSQIIMILLIKFMIKYTILINYYCTTKILYNIMWIHANCFFLFLFFWEEILTELNIL